MIRDMERVQQILDEYICKKHPFKVDSICQTFLTSILNQNQITFFSVTSKENSIKTAKFVFLSLWHLLWYYSSPKLMLVFRRQIFVVPNHQICSPFFANPKKSFFLSSSGWQVFQSHHQIFHYKIMFTSTVHQITIIEWGLMSLGKCVKIVFQLKNMVWHSRHTRFEWMLFCCCFVKVYVFIIFCMKIPFTTDRSRNLWHGKCNKIKWMQMPLKAFTK